MLSNVKVAGGIFQVGFDWSPAVCKIVCRHRIQVRAISIVGTPSGSAVHMFSFRHLCGTLHHHAGSRPALYYWTEDGEKDFQKYTSLLHLSSDPLKKKKKEERNDAGTWKSLLQKNCFSFHWILNKNIISIEITWKGKNTVTATKKQTHKKYQKRWQL